MYKSMVYLHMKRLPIMSPMFFVYSAQYHDVSFGKGIAHD